MVRAAACSGRRVSHALIAAVVGHPDDELERSLRTAVEQNVLVQVGVDSYAFRHALLAEAVYDDLLPGERVRLHAAYAEALRSRRVDGTAAELARHARLAHDPVTAVRASIEAGDEAMGVGGPEEAAAHYEAALELAADPRLDDRPRPGRPRGEGRGGAGRLGPPRAGRPAGAGPSSPTRRPPGRTAGPGC